MRTKLIIVIVAAATIAVVVLGLRQRRLRMMHQMTQMQQQMNQVRQRTWDLQVRIAEQVDPEALRAKIKRAGLRMEPVTPGDPKAAGWPGAVAEGPHR